MEEQKYFLPLNLTSPAHYFSRACLCPSKYLNNKPPDIQNYFENHLLISNNTFLNNAECSFELALSKNELKELKEISAGIYLYSKPLPITRVKIIHFKNEEQMKITLWNINDGAAFIPELLAKVTDIKAVRNDEIKNIRPRFLAELWNNEIELFDKYLGGIAFMKLGGESYMNYSDNYFSTLSYFNTKIKKDFQKALNNRKLINFVYIGKDEKYIGAFTKEDNWIRILNLINSEIYDETVENIAKEESIKINKNLGLFNFQTIKTNSNTYILSILATYGDKKRKKIEDFILDLYNGKISKERREGLTLLFGMYNGYSSFRNKYNLSIGIKSIKFKLNSFLDYYTIESIYQYVFNKKSNNSGYNYIDGFIITQKVKPLKGEYLILDVPVTAKKKEVEGTINNIDEILLKLGKKELFLKEQTDLKAIFDNLLKLLSEKDKEIQYLKNRNFQLESDKLNMNLVSDESTSYKYNKDVKKKKSSLKAKQKATTSNKKKNLTSEQSLFNQ